MNKDKERKLYKESKRNQYRGIFDTPLRPRAREGAVFASFASGRPLGLPTARRAQKSRYREAGAAADELIDILGGVRRNDHGTWAYYCYHHDIETLLEKAREYRKKYRRGEIKNPVTAFQRWLIRNYGREAK